MENNLFGYLLSSAHKILFRIVFPETHLRKYIPQVKIFWFVMMCSDVG
jgi:hypothetical protein